MANKDDVAQAVTRLKNFCEPFVGIAQILSEVEELHFDVEDLVNQKAELEAEIKALIPERDSLQAQLNNLSETIKSKT